MYRLKNWPHMWLLVVAFAAAPPVVAQQSESIPIGARVLVTLRDSLRPWLFSARTTSLIGTTIATSSDQLTLRLASSDTVRISRASVRAVAISRGASRGRSSLQQAAFGALVGSVASIGKQKQWVGVIAGAGVGAVTGFVAPYEHWRRVRW